MKKGICFLFCSVVFALAYADESSNCYEMYPVESYGAEESYQLINECLASVSEEVEDEDMESYDGTVEDFLSDLPEGDSDDIQEQELANDIY